MEVANLGVIQALQWEEVGYWGGGGDTQQQESLTRMDCISLTDTQWLLEGSVSESWEAAPQPRDQEGSHWSDVVHKCIFPLASWSLYI